MLTATLADPALFGRDAPPVFNNVGIDGKFTYVDNTLYSCTNQGRLLDVRYWLTYYILHNLVELSNNSVSVDLQVWILPSQMCLTKETVYLLAEFINLKWTAKSKLQFMQYIGSFNFVLPGQQQNSWS